MMRLWLVSGFILCAHRGFSGWISWVVARTHFNHAVRISSGKENRWFWRGNTYPDIMTGNGRRIFSGLKIPWQNTFKLLYDLKIDCPMHCHKWGHAEFTDDDKFWEKPKLKKKSLIISTYKQFFLQVYPSIHPSIIQPSIIHPSINASAINQAISPLICPSIRPSIHVVTRRARTPPQVY